MAAQQGGGFEGVGIAAVHEVSGIGVEATWISYRWREGTAWIRLHGTLMGSKYTYVGFGSCPMLDSGANCRVQVETIDDTIKQKTLTR